MQRHLNKLRRRAIAGAAIIATGIVIVLAGILRLIEGAPTEETP